MGAIAAAAIGAPISTTLIVFEMKGDYTLTLAVMIAVVISSVIAQQSHGKTVFSWQLENRGLNLPVLAGTDDLDAALKLMRDTGEEHAAVVQDLETMKFIECVHERDVMSADNTVLLENRREERDN